MLSCSNKHVWLGAVWKCRYCVKFRFKSIQIIEALGFLCPHYCLNDVEKWSPHYALFSDKSAIKGYQMDLIGVLQIKCYWRTCAFRISSISLLCGSGSRAASSLMFSYNFLIIKPNLISTISSKTSVARQTTASLDNERFNYQFIDFNLTLRNLHNNTRTRN